ncbi:hypothetical protein [Exiguobacterium sp. S22-S28]|uniref:hypothetical protein n=1 Tax=Exiguobacterium sp. S22-S28 TaxID=3342768 RepID=UPI00372D3194
MGLYSIILVVFSFVPIFILMYLFVSLFRWNTAFEKWKKSSIQPSDNIGQEFEHFNLSSPFEITSDPKLEKIISVSNLLEVNLSTILTSDHLLIFLDKKCVFCNSNFEEFVQLIEQNKNLQKTVSIIFNKSQIEAANSFLFLHEYNFQVFLTEDDSLRDSFKKSFLPMYVHTEFQSVQNISASPFEVLN